MRFSGAVLAGGSSRRFGRDKARVRWRGRTLLAHVLDSLQEAEERFVVASRPYPEAGVPVFSDRFAGSGPLAGVHAALFYARTDVVAVAACDLPNLTADYWRYLLDRLGGAPAVAVLGPGGRPEPLAAFYTRTLLLRAERMLETGERRVARLLVEAGARFLPWSEVAERFGPRVLWNVNRPGDLQNG